MKKLFFLLIIISACQPGAKEASQQDLIANADSITLLNSDEEDVDVKADEYDEQLEVNDSTDISDVYEQYKTKFEEASTNYYEVHISYNLYEASSEVTWLFDESFSPRFFNESWSVEGSEGSTNYFIKNQSEVVCAEEVENAETKKWCTGYPGVKFVTNDEGNTSSETLPGEFPISCNQNLKSKMEALLSIMDEGERSDKDSNTYRFRMEKVVNYGQEVTETVEVIIPKLLCKELVGD